MSGEKIYTGAEAAALLDGAERPVAPSHTHTLTLTTGETALLHAAPALVASVAHWEALAQRAEVERDTMRDDLESECRFAEGRRLERDALRAIIEGRTVPPTDAECVAVIAAGGWWRWVALEDGRPLPDVRGPLFDPRSVPRSALEDVTRREGRTYSERWWCLDAQRRPCAWPTTEAPR